MLLKKNVYFIKVNFWKVFQICRSFRPRRKLCRFTEGVGRWHTSVSLPNISCDEQSFDYAHAPIFAAIGQDPVAFISLKHFFSFLCTGDSLNSPFSLDKPRRIYRGHCSGYPPKPGHILRDVATSDFEISLSFVCQEPTKSRRESSCEYRRILWKPHAKDI